MLWRLFLSLLVAMIGFIIRYTCFTYFDLDLLDKPLLANINLSITYIGFYMTIAAFVAFYFNILATNHSKITPNKLTFY